MVKIMITKSEHTDLDFNIIGPGMKTAFIYDCINNQRERRQELVRHFLEHAQERVIQVMSNWI